MRIFEAFAGYGGASFALKRANISFVCVGFSEIDKYAIQIYEKNHSEKGINLINWGDITQIDWQLVPDFDLLTGGFPCQDLSQAGKQDLSKGRSVLVFELTKALRAKQPKYFLFENVPAIEQEKFKEFLRQAENEMKRAGYQVFRIKLNSKDFGIPQNRERIWFIGFRKDLSKPFGWNPHPTESGCNLKLKDVLEKEVLEKYFLTEKALSGIINHWQKHKAKGNGFGELPFNENDLSSSLNSRDFKQPKTILDASQSQRIYSTDGTSIALKALGGGQGAKTGLYAIGCAIRSYPRTSSNDKNRFQNLELGNEVANSLTMVQKDSMVLEPKILDLYNQKVKDISITLTDPNHNTIRLLENSRVRKLTPKECFRLMGFLNDEINLEGISDSQAYKLAGNGWEINIVSKIFFKMFEEEF